MADPSVFPLLRFASQRAAYRLFRLLDDVLIAGTCLTPQEQELKLEVGLRRILLLSRRYYQLFFKGGSKPHCPIKKERRKHHDHNQ